MRPNASFVFVFCQLHRFYALLRLEPRLDFIERTSAGGCSRQGPLKNLKIATGEGFQAHVDAPDWSIV
jgi:hypothetical protein